MVKIRSVFPIFTVSVVSLQRSSLNLASATIHTVDLPTSFRTVSDVSHLSKDDFHLIKERDVGHEYKSDSSITNIVQHFGDTATWDFSEAEGASFFFIDGSHTYDYVRNDTEKALAGCHGQDTTLIWHDCDDSHPGVVRWLREMLHMGYPVKHIKGTQLGIMDRSA